MSSLLYTEYSRKWQSRISRVFFNYMCTHTSLVKHIFFHIIYTGYIVFNVIFPSVAWNTSHLIAFYNSKLQFDSVIIYIQYKHFFFTQITNFTHVFFPSRQATTITAARHPVTSSWDSASHAASLLTVISIIALRTNCQIKHSYYSFMTF